MKLVRHLNQSMRHLQESLHHLPWQEAAGPADVPSEPPTGSFVLAVALVSVAAAAVLILAP